MKKFKMTRNLEVAFGFSLMLIMTSCSKSSMDVKVENELQSTVKSKSLEVPNVRSIEEMKANGELWNLFMLKENENLENINLNNAKFYKVTFDRFENLVGLQIILESESDTSKDLFFVIDKQTQTHLTILREKIGFKHENKGFIVFKSTSGNIMHENYFENNKIVKNKIIRNIESNINKSLVASIDGLATLKWSCTQTQFDNYYKEAKKRCEDDTLCDFVCSFNPCAISYLAYAVGACTGIIEN